MARHGDGSVYPDPKRGPGHWLVSVEAGWTRSGTRKRIRRRVTGTKRDATVVLRQLLRDPNPSAGQALTVKVWADRWIDLRKSTARPATYTADRSAVKWIVETIGHRRLDKLTPGDIRAVSDAVLEAGRTLATARRARAVLSKLLKDARAEGYSVPTAAVDVYGLPVPEVVRAQIPERAAPDLLRVILDQPDASRWLLAGLHAVRPAECLGLLWDHVDLEQGLAVIEWQLKPLPYKVAYDRASGYRVPIGYTARHLVHAYHLVRPKTEKGRRVVALHPVVVESLRRWQQLAQPSPYGLVWPRADGMPQIDKRDRERWAELCAEAKLAPVDLYAARHAAATAARAAGADDQTMVAMMGHSSILSTIPYMHHADVERQRAVSAGVGDWWGLKDS